jgi:porin
MVVCLVGVAFCLFQPQEAQGQGSDVPPGFPFPAADSPLGWEGALFGKCQTRKNLADRGITFLGINQMFAPANVAGGKRTAMDPTNRFIGTANLDFEKLFCCRGSQFRISFAQNDGQNLADEIGTPYNPSTLFQESGTRLWQLYLGQWFWDKQAHVKIGRISANNEDFNWTPFGFPFASVGYDAAPGPMYLNNPGFGAEPVAQWGARLRIEPHDADYVFRFGVYNSSETFGELVDPSEHGLNFRFRPDEGTLYATEYYYKRNQDPEDRGLPGNYRVGALYDTASFDQLDVPGTTKRGNFNFYLSVDQMIYREGCGCCDDDQGLWAFAAFVTNPDQAVAGDGPANYPYFASWGLHYKGLFAGRDDDWTSFGNYYNVSSKYIPGDLEVQFDFAHVFAIKSWLVVTPEIQYIVDPGGTGTIPDALVLNLQTMAFF